MELHPTDCLAVSVFDPKETSQKIRFETTVNDFAADVRSKVEGHLHLGHTAGRVEIFVSTLGEIITKSVVVTRAAMESTWGDPYVAVLECFRNRVEN